MAQSKRILWAVMLTCFLGPFMASSINVAVPAMVNTFHSSPEDLTWAITAFLIGSTIALLPFGSLADLKGRRKIYFLGVILTCFFTFLTGMLRDYQLFIIGRFLQGIVMSMIFGTGMALLVSCYPPEKRGKIIGLASACVYIGLSVGPFLGGLITDHLGWPYIFYFTGAALFCNALFMIGIQEDWYGEHKATFDYLGAITSAAILFIFLYTVSTWTTHPYIHYLIILGLLLLLFFIKHQLKIKEPLVNLRIFKNTLFSLGNLAALIHYSATFAISFLISLYLQYIRGMDAATAGLFLLIQPGFMAILSPITGALSDKYQPRYLASTGMGLMLLGLGYFHFYLTPQTDLVIIIFNLAVIGIGFSLFAAPNNNAIMGAIAPNVYGIASSILAVVRLIGQALSMAIVTFLLATHIQYHQDVNYNTELLGSIHTAFLIFALFCCIGILASWYQPKVPSHQNKQKPLT